MAMMLGGGSLDYLRRCRYAYWQQKLIDPFSEWISLWSFDVTISNLQIVWTFNLTFLDHLLANWVK